MIRLRSYLCLFYSLFNALGIVSLIHGQDSETLSSIFEEYWAFEMENNPFSATFSGIHSYNDRVPDASPQARERERATREAFRDRLFKIDRDAISQSEAMSVEILNFILKHDIASAAFEPWRIPFVSDSGFHTTFGYVVSATPFETEEDYRQYLKRLERLPRFLEQNKANMEMGLADGFSQPQAIIENLLPSFEALAEADADEHPYTRPFRSMPETIEETVRREIEESGLRIMRQTTLPALKDIARFMRREYLPRARETLGATALPDGQGYYESRVRYFTTLDDATAEEVHDIGAKEVARIRQEMERIIASLDFEGDFKGFLEFLRTDERFYAKTAGELIMRASWISKKADGRLPAFFGKLPRQPYSVEAVPPELAPNYTGGRYVPASPSASRGGRYWVNTFALDKRPLYQLVALTLHEAVPGHHLQMSLAYEIESVPEFRKRFYPHAFGEGWGLYAEALGVEMGLYETPYDHFGRLSYEMWRACRLVVDTGIHAKGWSRQQAIDYLASNTALSLHEVGTEIDRYIAWPGQALAYKIGELAIWELRKEAEETLGENFDIRAFHDKILEQGGLPLEALRKRVRAFVELSASEYRSGVN